MVTAAQSLVQTDGFRRFFQVFVDDFLGRGEDFLQRHRRGVEDDGVFGGPQGGFGTITVASVAGP